MPFSDRLFAAIREKGTPVLAGIDPRAESLPPGFLVGFGADRPSVARAFAAFSRDVIDALAPLVPAVKFQAAFFEALGPEGMIALGDALAYARSRGMLVILDGKRNDIGSTAEAYATAYMGPDGGWEADALTINAYLGVDGIAPFVRAGAEHDTGAFVLVRTSNPSARDLQDLRVGDRPLYRHVADLVTQWGADHRGKSGYSLLGAVVGATYPQELAELREVMPGVVLLVPGYGAQGGTAADVASAFDADGLGAIVNNSRGLAFAYLRKDLAARFGDRWQRAVEAAAIEMIEALASATPAGRLRAPGSNPA